MQLELPGRPAPFADDLAMRRIVAGLDPFQVADRLRADDDLVKAGGLGRRVDAPQHLVEPFADGAEHRVIVRVGVVAEGPMLP